MIRLFLYALIVIGGALYLLQVDSPPAPSAQQEAQDAATDVHEAKRAARKARAEQAIEAELLRRGCK